MNTTIEQLQVWMDAKENEHLEFKEAKNHSDFEELVKYCVALANEGGGQMILGVTDKVPRRVVGTAACDPLERTKAGLIERIHLRVDAEVFAHPNGRVLIFHVPSRPIGMPIQYKGAYWMRGGEELVPMTADMLQRIFAEAGPDFSAEMCSGTTWADLEPQAIENFRQRWLRKSGNVSVQQRTPEQLLSDAELVIDGHPTFAALVLFGTAQALGRHLAQAEVVYEFRSTENAIKAGQRLDFRRGFFDYHDELWLAVNAHNEIQQYQEGLFRYDISTFDEQVVRETILNAICHRDYRLGGSVFVRQFPRKLEVISPGGFPPGVTPENIVDKQFPRNRRIRGLRPRGSTRRYAD